MEKYNPDILYVAYEENMAHASVLHGYGPKGWLALDTDGKEDLGLGLLDNTYCGLPCCFGSVCTQFYRTGFLKKNQLYFLPQLRRMEDTGCRLQPGCPGPGGLSLQEEPTVHLQPVQPCHPGVYIGV